MKVKLGKRKLGQHVKLPGHCFECIFKPTWEFCIYKIRCTTGYFNNCTSEDIFKL